MAVPRPCWRLVGWWPPERCGFHDRWHRGRPRRRLWNASDPFRETCDLAMSCRGLTLWVSSLGGGGQDAAAAGRCPVVEGEHRPGGGRGGAAAGGVAEPVGDD